MSSVHSWGKNSMFLRTDLDQILNNMYGNEKSDPYACIELFFTCMKIKCIMSEVRLGYRLCNATSVHDP